MLRVEMGCVLVTRQPRFQTLPLPRVLEGRSQRRLPVLRRKEERCGPELHTVRFLWRPDQQAVRVINVFTCLSLSPRIRWLA